MREYYTLYILPMHVDEYLPIETVVLARLDNASALKPIAIAMREQYFIRAREIHADDQV